MAFRPGRMSIEQVKLTDFDDRFLTLFPRVLNTATADLQGGLQICNMLISYCAITYGRFAIALI